MFSLRNLLLVFSAATTVSAHCGMSNFYVDGVDQGDAVCVRMNQVPDLWTNPIENLASNDMACGFNGTTGVGRVCPVPDGATLTFEFREDADKPGGGVIDPSHLGPCSVYMKKVDSAISDAAAGGGWFKIWDEGYDESAKQWCTTKLINNGGFLSVNLPQGLVGGYYLVRPDLLALHEAEHGDPQYYVGCAQIFLQSSGNLVPQSTVSIPGSVSVSDPSNSFNIYNEPMALPYPLPGPQVATFKAGGRTTQATQTEGQRPAGCICESGSNFCGVEVPDYSGEDACYKSSEYCWKQTTSCYNKAPPTGDDMCRAWENKCTNIQNTCEAGGRGPPNKGVTLNPPAKTISPPAPLGSTMIGSALFAALTGTSQPTAPSDESEPSSETTGYGNSATASSDVPEQAAATSSPTTYQPVTESPVQNEKLADNSSLEQSANAPAAASHTEHKKPPEWYYGPDGSRQRLRRRFESL